MFRALLFAPTPPPRRAVNNPARLFQNRWEKTRQPDAGLMASFAYQGQALEPLALIGGSYHAPVHPQPIGSVPMIATQTLRTVGMPFNLGQFKTTPLSKLPGGGS